MNKHLITVVLILLSLMFSAVFSNAVEVKTKAAAPDIKGTAKAGDDKAKTAVADEKSAAKGKIVDINSATDTELKSIAGIGDAYAAKIIAGRPYANKTQLKSRNILPGPLYEQVKDKLIAKQAKT